jgi:hypothetical protein
VITDDLNIVIPVSETCRAYHTPISEEVFEASFRVIAATHAALFSQGVEYSQSVGTRIAALTLKDEGERLAKKREEPGDFGATAVLADIRRLTNILAPTKSGWDMFPVEAALEQNIISAENWKEAEAALIFFTCPYVIARPKQREGIAKAISGILGGLVTSLNITDYIDSLATSTKAEPTKAT